MTKHMKEEGGENKIDSFLMYVNPDDRDMARGALEELLSQATKEVVEGERARIYDDLIERAEPYEGAEWLNTLNHIQIANTVFHPHSKDEK